MSAKEENEMNISNDDLESLGAFLDDVPEEAPPSEKPSATKKKGNVQDLIEGVDDEVEELEEELEEEEEPDPEEEELEEEEEELDEKSAAAMKSRIDKLTWQFKSEAERSEKLEKDLAEAESKLAASAQLPRNRYTTPDEVDARMSALSDRHIPELEELVEDEPNVTLDDMGDKVENTVTIKGREYKVRDVKALLKDMRKELQGLPKERQRLEGLAQANEEGRKLLPAAWRRGNREDTLRRELIREMPEVAALGDKVVAQVVLGRLALAHHQERRSRAASAAKKSPKGIKASAGKTRGRKRSAGTHVDGLDPALAELAAVLDD